VLDETEQVGLLSRTLARLRRRLDP
jgi:hypothetical protein